MRAFGSVRGRYCEWRFTCRYYGRSRIFNAGKLEIKSRKRGRKWSIDD